MVAIGVCKLRAKKLKKQSEKNLEIEKLINSAENQAVSKLSTIFHLFYCFSVV